MMAEQRGRIGDAIGRCWRAVADRLPWRWGRALAQPRRPEISPPEPPEGKVVA